MEILSRVMFGFAALALMALAVMLVVTSGIRLFHAAGGSAGDLGTASLEAIGYVIISAAVFDVGRYLFQEEVQRGREMRAPSETRRSLTKFLSTIAIAVFLEALVTAFAVSKEHVPHMIYPTLLLLAAVLLVLGLGAFQWMSVQVEGKVGSEERDQA